MSNAMVNADFNPERFDTIETLAKWISIQTPILDRAKAIYTKGSLAIGAAIVIYSETKEVQDEVEEANRNKGRGRPWTEIGYVAAKLEEQFGAAVPSAKWLLSCGKAAQIARSKNIVDGNVKKLLGWQSSITIDEKALKEVEVNRLLDLPGEKSTPEPKDISELILSLAETLNAKTIALIEAAQKAGKRIGAREVAALLEAINPTLEHIGVSAEAIQKKKHKTFGG